MTQQEKTIKAYNVQAYDDSDKPKYRTAVLTIWPEFKEGQGYDRPSVQLDYQCNNLDCRESDDPRPPDTSCHPRRNYGPYYADTWRNLDFHRVQLAAKMEKAITRKIRQLGIERHPCSLERHVIALRALGYIPTRCQRQGEFGFATFYATPGAEHYVNVEKRS